MRRTSVVLGLILIGGGRVRASDRSAARAPAAQSDTRAAVDACRATRVRTTR